jgi:hypothetical protein
MARSHSILRRYTPPTCTLEIIAKNSALSRWVGKPVVDNLQFQLSLDDPKLDREEWLTIQGDRAQLAALCEAVSNYVQSFLGAAPERVSMIPVEADAAIATLTPAAAAQPPTGQATANSLGISLQPQGMLNHELYWGELATADTGPTTQLSTLQLFDLANALEDYATDVLELPDREARSWVKPLPNWAQVAAVVLVAVGLSTSAIRLLDGSGNLSPATPVTSQGASSNDQQIATQLPPAVVEKATPPVASNQKLPPPPPLEASPNPLGQPTVTTPKSPAPSPASGTVSPNVVAAYPVPVVPGSPKVIAGEAESAPTRSPAQSAPAPNINPDSVAVAPNPQTATGRAFSESVVRPPAVAYEAIPQVAEVKSFFQQKWNPPEGLNQILEYSIQLNADGTIETISPLRQASGDYIDRTGMPLVGEPFVSPLKGRQTAKIRVVLEPNGQVRAFLEE